MSLIPSFSSKIQLSIFVRSIFLRICLRLKLLQMFMPLSCWSAVGKTLLDDVFINCYSIEQKFEWNWNIKFECLFLCEVLCLNYYRNSVGFIFSETHFLLYTTRDCNYQKLKIEEFKDLGIQLNVFQTEITMQQWILLDMLAQTSQCSLFWVF